MRTTLAVICLILLCAPVALADGTGTSSTSTSTLSSSAPWLTRTSPTSTPVSAQTSTVTASGGDLPFTGDNLLPETIGAVLLIAAGISIRLRRRPRW